jgi:uncharacterized protein YndB with AHSA1/START domain
MTSLAKLIRTIEVPTDPERAFRAFTDEIGSWYRGGPHSWNDPDRAIGIRFEPGVGGRLLEIYAKGEPYVRGDVTAWEPGSRLVFEWHSDFLPRVEPPTEVEVRFTAIPEGTRVTLEHRGLERLPEAIARRFATRAWARFVRWYAEYLAEQGR